MESSFLIIISFIIIFFVERFVDFYILSLYNIDNIICLTRQLGDVFSPFPRILRKVVIIMSTYEELQIIFTIALLIVAILNLKNKK